MVLVGVKPIGSERMPLWPSNQYVRGPFVCGERSGSGLNQLGEYRIPTKPPEIAARIVKTAPETGSTCLGPFWSRKRELWACIEAMNGGVWQGWKSRERKRG